MNALLHDAARHLIFLWGIIGIEGIILLIALALFFIHLNKFVCQWENEWDFSYF